jgi:hypothetical protein
MIKGGSEKASPAGGLSNKVSDKGSESPLVEGEDYYVEDGLYVFTAAFLLRRGYCCRSGCRHCPYPKESDR